MKVKIIHNILQEYKKIKGTDFKLIAHMEVLEFLTISDISIYKTHTQKHAQACMHVPMQELLEINIRILNIKINIHALLW